MFLGASALLLFGASRQSVPLALLLPVGWGLLVYAGISIRASGRADEEFNIGAAEALKLGYYGDQEILPLTPLLGAGDRRRFEHCMQGPLRTGGPPVTLSEYTFEIRHSNGDKPDTWTPYHWTAAIVELEHAMEKFPGFYLREDKGWLGRISSDDWLPDRHLECVELESIAFNERCDLLAVEGQDPVALRRLFSPTFVVWLTDHPLDLGIELRAGTLVVYVPGPVEDLGNLALLLDATREILARVEAEL